MKKKLTPLVLAILTASFTYAIESIPDSMYVHFTSIDGTDSIIVHDINDIDSIVYYAPTLVESTSGTFTDSKDNTIYKWVKIGEQYWMAENLRATKYPDGTAIPQISGTSAWVDLDNNDTDDAYCAYNNSTTYANTYGYLYTYAAALSACPAGWHLPSDDEWKTLEMYIGMSKTEADTTGYRGTEGVKLESTDFGGSDEYSFTALRGGYRHTNGTFYRVVDLGCWWSSSEISSSYAYARYLYYSEGGVNRSYDDKSRGFSVRCLRD